MSRSRARARIVGRKESGAFFQVPRAVLQSAAYRSVSAKAAKLMLDLGAQWNGYNNGDQCAAWRLMEEQGWKSRDTLDKAKLELLAAGLIEKTKQGGRNSPNLYAFTWQAIDECKGKLDFAPTRVASGKWKDPPSSPSRTPRPTRRPCQPDTPAVLVGPSKPPH